MSEILEVFTQFPSTQAIFGVTDVLVNVIMATLCAMVINFVYQKTHRSVTYSESLLLTLLMMTVLTAIVMMIIGSNVARAFSLIGALSIIRFRTAIKDVKDTGFIFFAIATGMGIGTGFYVVAITTTFALSIIIFILDRTHYGRVYNNEKLLILDVKSDDKFAEHSKELLNKHTRYHRLIHTDLLKEKDLLRLTYSILALKKTKGDNEIELVNLFKDQPNVRSVKMISGLQDNLVL